MTKTPKPLVLMILDGWGMKEGGNDDALSVGDVSNFDRYWETYPHTQLHASGMAVGLPEGQMGNSEVGHTNIGAGRIVYQDYTRISMAVEDGSIMDNEAFLAACENVKKHNSSLHLMGLVSDGGVHSHISHLIALVRLAHEQGIKNTYIHCFMDGRDTAPAIAGTFIDQLEAACGEIGCGQIATVCGRFYAMDRDKRWDRIEKAYRAMVYGEGDKYTSAPEAVKASFADGVTDEFIVPSVIVGDNGLPVGRIADNDSVIFINFRSDRARETCHALTDKSFDGFDRGKECPQVFLVTMTAYDDTLTEAVIAFPPEKLVNIFSHVLAAKGLRQLRLAETEKYAHVTFFFNGGEERVEEGEDRILVPSPKVRTYDLQPEMSAEEVSRQLVSAINSDKYDVIIINFANPDMVGHTGVREAIIKAVSFVDKCADKAVQAVLAKGGAVLMTADHGNAERMMENGVPMTAHTTNPVPFILINDELKNMVKLHEGRLCDIAPTMLDILGIEQPAEMTGRSLIDK